MAADMDIGKIMAAMVIAIFGMAVIAQVVQAQAPYSCPLCGGRFGTLAALEEHFASAHPAELIDVSWD